MMQMGVHSILLCFIMWTYGRPPSQYPPPVSGHEILWMNYSRYHCTDYINHSLFFRQNTNAEVTPRQNWNLLFWSINDSCVIYFVCNMIQIHAYYSISVYVLQKNVSELGPGPTSLKHKQHNCWWLLGHVLSTKFGLVPQLTGYQMQEKGTLYLPKIKYCLLTLHIFLFFLIKQYLYCTLNCWFNCFEIILKQSL